MEDDHVKIYIQEEQSLDEEFRHVKEEVGYMVLWHTPAPSPPVEEPKPVVPELPQHPVQPEFETDGFIEFGDITIDHEIQTVRLQHTF